MLLSLHVRHFVLVDELRLDFGAGYSVLTGETGAGKSILIDALQLALGDRAEADVVREGAGRAEVVAEFRPNAAAAEWLRSAALDDGDTLILRRVVDAGGRSRAFVNGTAVTTAQLRELGDLLVDVHGQHAHQSLLRAPQQLALLDEHGSLGAARRTVAGLHAAWRKARTAREQAEAAAGSAQREADRLRWIVDELGPLAPQPGEWDAIGAEHKRLAHAASLLEGAQGAVDTLSEADDALLTRLDGVAARLEPLAGYDERLRPVLETLETARVQIDEAARSLNHYLARTEVDDARLREVEERLSALHAAARKCRCTPDELPVLLEQSQQQLAALAAASDLDGLRAAEQSAQAAYLEAARALSRQRAGAASHLAREVTRAMQDLAMGGGRFEVSLVEAEPSASGLERVEFLVAGHAGATPRPLAKVASGGELARIGLAIAVIAASATPVDTLIFDEVDAGIGGAVADTVGRLLSQLARTRQVLSVTHLPQVAARGDQHYAVSKGQDADGRPVSRIEALDRRARIEELARMLGGATITDTTRKHAREMLAG